MKRRSFMVSLLVTFSMFLAAPGPAQKVRVATAVRQPMYDLPFMAAEEKGFWKEQGVEVNWTPMRSGSVMHRAVAVGELDMTMTGATSAVQTIAAGVPQIMVADLKTDEQFFLWVRADSPLKEPKDLKGTRIGVTAIGGMVHAYARMVTSNLGLEKDVRFVGAGGVKEQAAALKAGATEITLLSFFAMAPLKLAGEVRELLAVQDYFPKEWAETALLARNEFAAKNPRVVASTIKAFFRATDFIKDNRPWALEKMKSSMGYTEEVANAIYPRLRYGKDGKINPRAVESIATFVVRYGIVAKEKMPPLDKIFDNSFAEEAAR